MGKMGLNSKIFTEKKKTDGSDEILHKCLRNQWLRSYFHSFLRQTNARIERWQPDINYTLFHTQLCEEAQ